MINNGQRVANSEIDNIFLKRWSPRSFNSTYELNDQQIMSLIESARWSPSSFNDQPWRFIVSKRSSSSFKTFTNLLFDSNQVWAKDASALVFIVSKKESDKTGKDNPMAEFDCGAAWMALTLQARSNGLYTHAMGGIHKDKAYEELSVPKEDFKILCAFAVGKKASADELPEDLKKDEKLNDRKETNQIFFNHKFNNIH